MIVNYGFLMVVFLLIGCNQAPTEPQRSTETKTVPALRTALQTGLVDVSLRKVYRYWNSGGDHYNTLQRGSYSGYAYEGTSWYVLPENTTQSGTHRLYELFGVNDGRGDHMASKLTSENGYASPASLGAVFTSQDIDIGIFPMNRYIKSFTSGSWDTNLKHHKDHLLAKNGENPSGYTLEGTWGYGWPAWDGKGAVSRVVKDGINIGISRSWGGAIFSLIRNNTEFINMGANPAGSNNAPGKLMQSSIFYRAGDNPTEAGDNYGSGSPVVNFDPNYNGIGNIRTRAIGLNYGCCVGTAQDPVPGISFDSPQLSGTEIEKNVSIIDANRIDYKTTFRLAKSVSVQDAYPALEGLTTHLNDGIFTEVRVYQFDPSSNSYLQIPGSPWNANVDDGNVTQYPNLTSNRSAFVMAYNPTTNIGFAVFPLNIAPFDGSNYSGTQLGFFRSRCDLTGGGATSLASLKLETREVGFTTKGRPARSGVQAGDVVISNHSVFMGNLNEILAKANARRPSVTFLKW